jgi:hypothetical protein
MLTAATTGRAALAAGRITGNGVWLMGGRSGAEVAVWTFAAGLCRRLHFWSGLVATTLTAGQEPFIFPAHATRVVAPAFQIESGPVPRAGFREATEQTIWGIA